MSGFDTYQDEIIDEKSDRAKKWDKSDSEEGYKKRSKNKPNPKVRKIREEQDEFFDYLDNRDHDLGDDIDMFEHLEIERYTDTHRVEDNFKSTLALKLKEIKNE